MNMIASAYKRFCRKRFELPGEADISGIENRIGVPLPPKYREFLLKYNGGFFTEPEITPPSADCPLDRLTFLCGIRASNDVAELASPEDLALFDDNDPVQVLPIGSTMMGGLIVLMTHDEDMGAIMYKEAYGEFYFLANGIEEFFGLLRDPADP